jgi:hypothetical protein
MALQLWRQPFSRPILLRSLSVVFEIVPWAGHIVSSQILICSLLIVLRLLIHVAEGCSWFVAVKWIGKDHYRPLVQEVLWTARLCKPFKHRVAMGRVELMQTNFPSSRVVQVNCSRFLVEVVVSKLCRWNIRNVLLRCFPTEGTCIECQRNIVLNTLIKFAVDLLVHDCYSITTLIIYIAQCSHCCRLSSTLNPIAKLPF